MVASSIVVCGTSVLRCSCGCQCNYASAWRVGRGRGRLAGGRCDGTGIRRRVGDEWATSGRRVTGDKSLAAGAHCSTVRPCGIHGPCRRQGSAATYVDSGKMSTRKSLLPHSYFPPPSTQFNLHPFIQLAPSRLEVSLALAASWPCRGLSTGSDDQAMDECKACGKSTGKPKQTRRHAHAYTGTDTGTGTGTDTELDNEVEGLFAACSATNQVERRIVKKEFFIFYFSITNKKKRRIRSLGRRERWQETAFVSFRPKLDQQVPRF